MRPFAIASGFWTAIAVSAALYAAQGGPAHKTIVPEVPANKDAGFTSIFDGKTLNGWDANPNIWRVENGTLSVNSRRPTRHPAVSSSGAGASLRISSSRWSIVSPTRAALLIGWLREEELAYAAAQWRQSGFHGSLNWYRNFDLNADLTRPFQNVKIEQPSFFIAGGREVSRESPTLKKVGQWLTDLRGTVIIDGAGHSVPMERPAEVK